MSEVPQLDHDHPAVWQAGGVAGRPGWGDPFASAGAAALRAELENGSGAAFLRGFPVGDHDRDGARAAFLEWCRGIGTPVPQNERGDLVFDVADAGHAEGDPRVRGPNTNRRLSFHTDRCDVIAFLCWRQAQSGGENELVSSMHLYREIARRRPDLLEVLLRPFVYKRHTVDVANDLASCEQPVFSFREGHFACSFLRVLIERADADPALPDLTPLQREALDFLEEVAAEPANVFRFRQERGDVLLLNNWVTLHRRSAFVDSPVPDERRCLFRVWLSVPNSRPIDPMFAANFGATGAGEVRGGFRVG